MAITSFPTRVDGSAGRVKSDAQPVSNLNTQIPSVEWNVCAQYLCDLGPVVGLSDGSTPGSIIARLDALEAIVGDFSLEGIINSASPDNDVNIPTGDPIILNSSEGAMLSLDSSLDDVELSGRSVVITAKRTPAAPLSTLVLQTADMGETAFNSGNIQVRCGTTEDGNGGTVTVVGGNTQTGNGGSITLLAGNTDSGTPGDVNITAGQQNDTITHGTVSIVASELVVSTDASVAGPVTYVNGISISGGANILSGDNNPDGNVPGTQGDIYISTAPGLYQSSGGTAWSAVGGSGSPVLWRWNETNTSQFLPAVDLSLGGATAGLTLSTVAGGPNGTLLRLNSTELSDGGVIFPIDFAFPRRYVVDVTFYRFSFTDTTNAGRNFAGVSIAGTASGEQVICLGNFNVDTTNPERQALAEIAIDAGSTFGPPFAFNAIASANWCPDPAFVSQSGLNIKYTVNTQRPFVAATPQITVTIEGSGPDAGTPQTYSRVNGSSMGVPAYPAGWDGATLNTLGLVILNGNTTTSWTADIESLRVLKHPDDL